MTEENPSITQFPKNIREQLFSVSLSEDEVQILEAFRFIKFGKITVYKKDNKKSGRIDIQTTY